MREREPEKLEKLSRYKGKAFKIGWKAGPNCGSRGRESTGAWSIISREGTKARHF